ncbi:MAG: caspase family protein [Gemmataceae bacterium]
MRPALLLLAIGLAAQAQGPGTELKRLRVLVVMDTDSNLEESLVIDRENVRGLFLDKIPKARATIDVLDGKKATPANVLKYYRELKTGPDEGLLCFFGGHGAIDVKRGHYFQMEAGPLMRGDLRRAMADTKAGLVVLLSDCCSSPFNLPKKKTQGLPIVGMPPPPPPGLHPTVHELFFLARGTIDISASRPGTPSWGDSERGGLFTSTVCRMLAEPVAKLDTNKDGKLLWVEFLPNLESVTEGEFKGWKARMPERERGRIREATQKPYAYKLSELKRPGVKPAVKPAP